MATGVSLRTITLLFSAGWGGSYFYNHADGTRDIIATQLGRAVRRAVAITDGKENDANNANSAENSALSALSDKVTALSRDITRSADRPVVVLGPPSSRVSAIADALSLAGWAVLAVGCGSAIYYVAVWKGWSLRDLAWVSQKSFDSTIDTMQKGLARVSGVISVVRREFGEKMKVIESQVDAVRTALSNKIEDEICEVKNGIGEVSAEVASVHNVLDDVNNRIDAIDGKLDTATNGIMALVRVVSSLAPDTVRPGNPFWELKQLADVESPPLVQDVQSPPMMRRRISYGIGGILNKDKPNGIKESSDVNYTAAVPIAQNNTR